MRPTLSYIVCCSYRSGSSLLADGLRQTGLAGDAQEYFGPVRHDTSSVQMNWQDAADDEYIDRILQLGTTQNGVFGLKLHWGHLPEAVARLRRWLLDEGSSVPDLFCRAFSEPLYISLTRRDKLAQAISLYRAIGTNRWWDLTDIVPDAAARQELDFDFHEIDKLRKYCEAAEEGWASFFRDHGIEPLVVVYEDFAAAYEATLRSVLRALGLADEGIRIAEPRFRKQADDLSAEWVRHFADRQRTIFGVRG